MIVALLYNLMRKELLRNKPVDIIAELDSNQTIIALKEAIEKNKHEVILIEADDRAYENLKSNRKKINLVFNIAEGFSGESRESFIPCVCEQLEIPYTGSSPLTLSSCLDKSRTKEILLFNNIPTPKFQFFKDKKEELKPNMKFPLIVKLNAEGSKMGLSKNSVVKNKADFERQLVYLFKTYNKEVIVEEFLTGREFTVGIIGNEKPIAFPPGELKFSDKLSTEEKILLFAVEKPLIPIIEPLYNGDILTEDNYSDSDFICPANISKELEQKLKETAIKAYKALKCRDWCRVDMRLDESGNINILELNPIAGIALGDWFPDSAKAAGFEYHQLLGKIIDFAMERYKKEQ